MNAQHIQMLVDRLVARDGCYRPVELLKRLRRLEPADERRWLRNEIDVLEDVFYGHPGCCLELLRIAEEWARRLDLECSDEAAAGRRVFRVAGADAMFHRSWSRRASDSQQDLFFDGGQTAARKSLERALLEADAAGAERELAEMARAGANEAVQVDAEHLVGAIAWLRQPSPDAEELIAEIRGDLGQRARRFLGRDDGERYLAHFRRSLAENAAAARFEAERPGRHRSAFLEELADWPAVIESVEAVAEYRQHAPLLTRLLRAFLATGERQRALAALALLCWRHPDSAEQWLETTADPDMAERVARFWDLEPPLPIGQFPAWLAAIGAPVPPPEDDDHSDHAELLHRAQRLRANPAERGPREWLQQHYPELMGHWLGRQRRSDRS
ncbi:hypothetical protein [Wenzhouxiangella sp. EGI_FJ10409]|uniref:hypothetical protein n=1 Tax=Wenzhouxiangella sp. EGI_FJ10409 TaxID=3243767 RepID=UPI0035D8F54F